MPLHDDVKLQVPGPVLHSARLSLQQPVLSDLDLLWDAFRHEDLRRGGAELGVGTIRSRSDLSLFIETVAMNRRDGLAYEYILFHSGDRTRLCVGGVAVQNIVLEGRRGELSYLLLPVWQCLGFATEAVLRLVSELFRVGFHRLEICCDPENRPSLGVARRAGFQLEGILRDSAFSEGVFSFMAIFSRLRTDQVGPATRL